MGAHAAIAIKLARGCLTSRVPEAQYALSAMLADVTSLVTSFQAQKWWENLNIFAFSSEFLQTKYSELLTRHMLA